MKRVLLIMLILLVSCSTPKEEFCGSSTLESCSSNSDCSKGGCSEQICKSSSEEELVTTCEWKDCYYSVEYDLECGCIDEKCQWD